MTVARVAATSAHQLRGWKRSAMTMQPAALSIAMLPMASALAWCSGSGLSSRSQPSASVISPPASRYQRAALRK